MADNPSARTRLISLIEILTMYSDEINLLTLDEICEKLSEYGYEISKRTVLSDIKAVNTTPIKIISVNKPKKGYYLAKCFSQSAINLILEAVYSSDMLSEGNMEYITNYLRRHICLPTLDLILDTSQNFYSAIPKKEVSSSVLSNLRIAIKEKKQVVLKITRIVPGDRFSSAEKVEEIKINPVKIAIYGGLLTLVFTLCNTPDKAEFINIPRIKSVDITNNSAAEFNGELLSATNFFNSMPSVASRIDTKWLMIKFKTKDIELIENSFSSPVQFRKSRDEGYCVAKTYTVFDEKLLGWLFLMSDKVEILKPDSLKDFFDEKKQILLNS